MLMGLLPSAGGFSRWHGGPPFGIKYANEVTQELRKINPDFYIYFYIELEPAIEFKKFK